MERRADWSTASGEGGGAGMAEQAADAGPNEQEGKTLSFDDHLKLLKLLKIKLPKGALTPEVLAQSTRTNVIQDATRIKQDLEEHKLQMAQIPRLACGNIEEALKLKEKKKFKDITKMIFCRTLKRKPRETSTEKWRKKLKAGCGFRIRQTYNERPSCAVGGAVRKEFYGKHSEIKINAKECFKFFLKQKHLNEDDVNYKENSKLEFGFLSGKPTFLVEVRSSGEDVSPTEKIIIKCNSGTDATAREIFPSLKQGFQAEVNTSHQYYLQAQAFLFILKEKEKMEEKPVPVRAVMVMKVKPSGIFSWGEVSDDTEKMEQLNGFCKKQALPRFLAVLNLIFEKED